MPITYVNPIYSLISTLNIAISNGLIESDIEERYNFKPIYAAASLISDVDLTTLQNFE